MKNLVTTIALIFAFNIASSQTISLTFQAQDWGWLIGKNITSIYADSASASEFRKIREQIRAQNPPLRTTNVTVTGIAAWVGMAFYKTVKTGNAGEIAGRFTAITTQIESKPELSAQIQSYNTRHTEDFERTFIAGKTIVMDN